MGWAPWPYSSEAESKGDIFIFSLLDIFKIITCKCFIIAVLEIIQINRVYFFGHFFLSLFLFFGHTVWLAGS